MASFNDVLREIKVVRSELKNVRQAVKKINGTYHKDKESLISLLSETLLPTSINYTNTNVLQVNPIGYIESCFKAKNCTPRQASLCPLARACLTVSKTVFTNPEHSLEGLQEFSHIWIVFVFHKNKPTKTPKAKVHPPRLNGEAVGIFSTRSPHRPNPLGLSLTQVEKIEGSTIYLLGTDLVDGTPVLDIKPYIPSYDQPLPKHSSTLLSHVELKNYNDTNQVTLQEADLKKGNVAVHSSSHSTLNTSDLDCCDNSLDASKHIGRVDKPNVCAEANPPFSTVSADALQQYMHPMMKEIEEGNNLNSDVKMAEWLLQPPVTELSVAFTNRAEMDLQKFHNKSIHEPNCSLCLTTCANATELKMLIIEVLKQDPRSVYRRNKCSDRLYYFYVDNIHVTCWFDDDESLVEVLKIRLSGKDSKT